MKTALLVLLTLAAPLARSEEEDEPAPATAGPEAAAAARDKGFRADEPAPAGITGGAPAAPQGDPRVIAIPAQRALGGGGGSGSGSGGGAKAAGPGGGGTAGAGISCEKSVPALTGGVVRKDIDFVKTTQAPVTNWAVPPNGAISYKFTTPASGAGTFQTNMGTSARPVGHLVTLSRTPCDFDVEKARARTAPCHQWAPVENGLMFTIGAAAGAPGCALKPNTVYYFNLRALSSPSQGAARDACQDEMPFFRSRPDLPRLCGGIWKMAAATPVTRR